MPILASSQKIVRLQTAVEADGFNQNAHFLLGEEYLRENRPMQAAAKFRRVVELNPDHAEAWLQMGISFEQAGVDKEAQAAFETASRQFDRAGFHENARQARARLTPSAESR